jgi:hypothetical protein
MTQEIIMTHKYVHGMDLYSSKLSIAGCRFYNKLPKNIKQIDKGIEDAPYKRVFLLNFPILVADTIRREKISL